MAYEKLTDLGTDQVFALGHGEGKQLKVEGYYLGSRTVTTSNGQSVIHVFQTPKGNVGVWGTKKLNDNLGGGTRGAMLLIEYKGKVKLQGGKTQHTYEFNIDRDNTIEVPRLSSGASEAPVQIVEADGSDDDDTGDTGYNNGKYVAAQSVNRAADVAAMLKGKNKQA
jgi:hypothetical protein